MAGKSETSLQTDINGLHRVIKKIRYLRRTVQILETDVILFRII